MKKIANNFQKSKDYLICIDSDGCVMDTMDVKHMRCFGPCLVHEWGLEKFRDGIIAVWRRVNLLSARRGVNRFSGLAKVLCDINENYMRVEGLDDYLAWADSTDELSEASLQAAYEKTKSPILKKALEWSWLVNESMAITSDRKKQPFDGAEDALKLAKECADVVIVTAAIGDEIRSEWETAGIYQYTDYLMSQETGTKGDCLKALLEKGYDPDHVIMIGDAPADLEAAEEAGVLFYPILAYQEIRSWEAFKEAAEHFLGGTYKGAYEDAWIREFKENLRID